MSSTPHLSVHKGKRVRVVLRNGEKFIGKFLEKTGRYVYINDIRFRTRDIASLTIHKRSNQGSDEAQKK